MVTREEILSWRDREVVDARGSRIGRLAEIYLDADTDEPKWAAVHTELLGEQLNLVPLEGAARDGDSVLVPFPRTLVDEAPAVDPESLVSPAEEAALHRHYGLPYGDGARSGREPASGSYPVPSSDYELSRSATEHEHEGRDGQQRTYTRREERNEQVFKETVEPVDADQPR